MRVIGRFVSLVVTFVVLSLFTISLSYACLVGGEVCTSDPQCCSGYCTGMGTKYCTSLDVCGDTYCDPSEISSCCEDCGCSGGQVCNTQTQLD
jgi:hypothetical protein